MAVLRPEHAPTTLTSLERRAELLGDGRAPTPCWRCRSTATSPPGRPEEFVDRVLVDGAARRAPSWSAPTSASATGPPATWRRCARPARARGFDGRGDRPRRRPAGLVLDVRPHLPGRRRRRRRRRGARPPVRRARRGRARRPARPRAGLPDRQRAHRRADRGAGRRRVRRLAAPPRHRRALPGRDQRRHQPDLRRRARAPGRELRAGPHRPRALRRRGGGRRSCERLRGMVAFDSVEALVEPDGRRRRPAPARCWGAPREAGAAPTRARRPSEWFLQHGLSYFVPERARTPPARRCARAGSCRSLLLVVAAGRRRRRARWRGSPTRSAVGARACCSSLVLLAARPGTP